MRKNPLTERQGPPIDFEDLMLKLVHDINKQLKWVGVNRRENELVYLCIEAAYSSRISNTHASPLNGKTNWGRRDPSLPTYYPGWQGKVWIGFKNKLANDRLDTMSASQLLDPRCIYTGTGGGGIYDYPFQEALRTVHKGCHPWSYGVCIFEDDWPTLRLARLLDPMERYMNIGYHHPDYHIFPEEEKCIQTEQTSRSQSQCGLPPTMATT